MRLELQKYKAIASETMSGYNGDMSPTSIAQGTTIHIINTDCNDKK
jgi:hypothetical protein